VMCSGFGIVKCGCGASEKCLAVVATERAGKCAEVVGLEFVDNCAAQVDTDYPPVENVGNPDGSLRVKANAIGCDVRLFKDLAHIRGCRRIAEGSPRATLTQLAIGDSECGQAVGQCFGDDEGMAIRRKYGAIWEGEILRGNRGRAVGSDGMSAVEQAGSPANKSNPKLPTQA
jgi:hypothetical protein